MPVAEQTANIAWTSPPIELHPLGKAEGKRWRRELLTALEKADLSDFSALFQERTDILDFVTAVLTLSDYLRDLIMVEPARIVRALQTPPDQGLERLTAEARQAWCNRDSSGLMRALRQAKADLALVCGLADLGGWWGCEEVTGALSDFADAAISATLNNLLSQLHATGKIVLPYPEEPQRGTGFFVFGMGKYGARELNYSSDIDIILFLEESAMEVKSDDRLSLFIRLAKSLVRILQERTGHGYVFRVDLRLRPDPGSTPLVMPAQAALNYYEAYGQNWERAAMIKSRVVAGDFETGDSFHAELQPFVWRKYLDYAAISDIHSIKRQIHAHRGHETIAIAGHNIKLGRGGIREIEFFAQTQQLIAGGRVPQLRRLRTIDALGALCDEGWIDVKARDALSQAYRYLRNVEHRIQMVADEQSHTLPDDDAGLRRIALMMGERSLAAFSRRLTNVLKSVEAHYAGLFEKSPRLSVDLGNLVFTGDDDDPATVETLARMGFTQPSQVIRMVRGWHFGRFPAIRSAQARELLTELTPGLLQAIADTGEPDTTMAAFDRFVSGLPAGIQLFALLKSNPHLLRMLLLILSSAPRLADIITRRPHVFDAFLEPAFASQIPDRAALAERLSASLDRVSDFEAFLDAARIFSAEQKFLLGLRLIDQSLSPGRIGRAYANLADLLIAAMLDRVTTEFRKRHGSIAGGRICILGMGRLGSRELTAGSDLDLILLYDHHEEAEYSDGSKPLAASQYYIRLTQRLIAAMSAPTAEGVLFDLDFRLRPSGNAGPLATRLGSFLKYQRGEAWTWEKQALTRARVVAGDSEFGHQIENEIRRLLQDPLEPEKLSRDVREMRELIAEEKPAKNLYDIKLAWGGMIDIEFLAQWGLLRTGLPPQSTRPVATMDMIEHAAHLFSPAEIDALREAWYAYNRLLQLQRVCIDGTYDPSNAPPGLNQIILSAFDQPQISALEAYMVDLQQQVAAIFARHFGE